jgi:hypothetical protein
MTGSHGKVVCWIGEQRLTMSGSISSVGLLNLQVAPSSSSAQHGSDAISETGYVRTDSIATH